MISVMAILLGREKAGEVRDVKVLHTLAFFGTGVLVLGLDAFLFGNISALGKPDKDSENIRGCKIAWIEAMPATSMLMVGSSLMVAGLAWVLCQYLTSPGVWNANSDEKLDCYTKCMLRLPGIMTGAVLLATSPWVVLTVLIFLDQMTSDFDSEICPAPIKCVLLTLLVLCLLVIMVIIAYKTERLVKYAAEEKRNRVEHTKMTALDLDSSLRWPTWTFIGAILVAVVGAVFAGLVGEHSPLAGADAPPGACLVYTAMAIAVVPLLLTFPIALAVPSAPKR